MVQSGPAFKKRTKNEQAGPKTRKFRDQIMPMGHVSMYRKGRESPLCHVRGPGSNVALFFRFEHLSCNVHRVLQNSALGTHLDDKMNIVSSV